MRWLRIPLHRDRGNDVLLLRIITGAFGASALALIVVLAVIRHQGAPRPRPVRQECPAEVRRRPE